jgi:hypothetical protein
MQLGVSITTGYKNTPDDVGAFELVQRRATASVGNRRVPFLQRIRASIPSRFR